MITFDNWHLVIDLGPFELGVIVLLFVGWVAYEAKQARERAENARLARAFEQAMAGRVIKLKDHPSDDDEF